MAAPLQGPVGWEKLDYSRSPFQKAEGIRSARDFQRGLRLMMLTNSDEEWILERFVPYPGERRGFAIDENWRRTFPLTTSLHDIAAVVASAFQDRAWPVR
jgi:hypothetical protein